MLLRSPRARRRLGIVTAAAAAAALVLGVVALLPDGPERERERFHGVASVASSAPAPRLTPRDRAVITTTLEQFSRTGLARRDLARAWELAGPGLRRATTRAVWLSGAVPFVRYSARPITPDAWRPNEVREDGASLDVLVQPAPGAPTGPATLTVDLHRNGRAWQVDSIYVAVTYSRADERPRVFSERDITPNGAAEAGVDRGRLSAAWLVVPALILAAAVAVPVVLALRGVRRRRETLELPPLPPRRP